MTQHKPNYNEVKHNLPQVYKEDQVIYEEASTCAKDFVVGAVVGGLIGTAVGLLLAPKAGSELRDDVAVQALNLKDKSLELSTTAKDKTAQLSQQIQNQTNQLVGKVKTLKADTVPSDDGTVSIEGEEPLEDLPQQ